MLKNSQYCYKNICVHIPDARKNDNIELQMPDEVLTSSSPSEQSDGEVGETVFMVQEGELSSYFTHSGLELP